MPRELGLESTVLQALENLSPGQRLTINFKGKACSVDVNLVFEGGWEVSYTLPPGHPFEMVKGEGGALQSVSLSLQGSDPLTLVTSQEGA